MLSHCCAYRLEFFSRFLPLVRLEKGYRQRESRPKHQVWIKRQCSPKLRYCLFILIALQSFIPKPDVGFSTSA